MYSSHPSVTGACVAGGLVAGGSVAGGLAVGACVTTSFTEQVELPFVQLHACGVYLQC
jgi:hypothetical protein